MPSLHEYQRRLTRNTVYLTAAFSVQKVLSSIYIFVYGNLIGTAATGSYLFATSFANLFGILADLGLSPILIRDVARQPSRARSLLRSTLFFKAKTSIAALLAVALVVPWTVHGALRRELLIFTTLVMLLESLTLSLYGVLRGLQKLRYEAIGSTLHSTIVFVFGTIALAVTRNPLWLGAALLTASVANATYALVNVRRHLRSLPQDPTDRRFPWSTKTVAPFFFSGVFTKIYAYVDIVLLGLLASDHYVGLYGVAYKLTYAFQFLPVAFNLSLYPALSQAFHESTETLRLVIERSMRFLLLISIPLSALIVVHARAILLFTLHGFVDGTPALQISVLSLPFLFLSFLLSSLLNATNLQARTTISLSIVVIGSIGLNLLLIPRYQHVGASIASLISTSLYAILLLFFARRYLPANRVVASYLVRLLAAAAFAVMTGIVMVNRMHVVFSLAVSAGSFILAAYRLRVLTLATLKSLLTAFKRQPAL